VDRTPVVANVNVAKEEARMAAAPPPRDGVRAGG